MERRILMLVCVCVSFICMAYSQISDVGKHINNLKRDGQYFYAESTLETEDAARESATLMLANFINDYINDKGLPHDKKVTEQDLANAPSLKMKRGTMIRVFVYVKKGDFVPVEETENTPVKEEFVSEGEPLKAKSTEEEDIVEEEKPVIAKETPIAATVVQEAPAVEDVPAVQEAPAVEETPAVVAEETQVESTDNSLRLPIAWQQAAIDNLVSKANLQEVMVSLNRMKAEYKVKRFGTYNECRNAAMSFWIICENDNSMNLVTVLGPGANERVNFKTMQYDSLGNYSGKNAIWFELAK